MKNWLNLLKKLNSDSIIIIVKIVILLNLLLIFNGIVVIYLLPILYMCVLFADIYILVYEFICIYFFFKLKKIKNLLEKKEIKWLKDWIKIVISVIIIANAEVLKEKINILWNLGKVEKEAKKMFENSVKSLKKVKLNKLKFKTINFYKNLEKKAKLMKDVKKVQAKIKKEDSILVRKAKIDMKTKTKIDQFFVAEKEKLEEEDEKRINWEKLNDDSIIIEDVSHPYDFKINEENWVFTLTNLTHSSKVYGKKTELIFVDNKGNKSYILEPKNIYLGSIVLCKELIKVLKNSSEKIVDLDENSVGVLNKKIGQEEQIKKSKLEEGIEKLEKRIEILKKEGDDWE